METKPSGTQPGTNQKKGMNIDISAREPGEKFLYTGPHLCVTCAEENRIVNRHFKEGDTVPECAQCGPRARWEP